MARLRHPFFAPLVALLALASPAAGAPPPGSAWTLVFSDEFNSATLDRSKWALRYHWGEARVNSELQAYVDDAFRVANGVLRVVGKREVGEYAGQTFAYRSGLIASQWHQKFGYFEIRCQMPAGKGIWPAFWLLHRNGLPNVEEIDVHEFLGHELTAVHMTVHWGPSYADHHQASGTWVGPDFTAGFHVFGVEWDASKVVWYVDGVERFRYIGEGVPQSEMYLIANLAIGGEWPGAPTAATVFPAYYDIDYIRAYVKGSIDAGQGGSDAGADVLPPDRSVPPDLSSAAVEPARDGQAGAERTPEGCACSLGESGPVLPPSGLEVVLVCALAFALKRRASGPATLRRATRHPCLDR